MNIHIEHNGTEKNELFDEQIQTKVGALQRHYDNIIDAIVYLHKEKETMAVELKLNVKDDTLFVKEGSDTFLNALEASVKTMNIRLKKYKETTLKNI